MRMILPAGFLRTADTERLGVELQELFGRDLADQPPIIGRQLRAMSRYDASPRLGALREIPTLVVSAAHDPIAPPRLGRAIAAGIGTARYIELAAAGHALPIQMPDETNALVVEHLGR
jgi:pimeloyl-ACP methyl ester carboxylesterase